MIAYETMDREESVGSQPSYYFTQELLDRYPPLPHFGIDPEEYPAMHAELLGHRMGGRMPTEEQLKKFECIEQYLMYNTYISW